MTEYISSDTNIWIDFANIDAVELPFGLDCVYLMYELSFEKEVKRPEWLKHSLMSLGIQLVDIDIDEYSLADGYGEKYRQLSVHDRIALAIAKHRNLVLMTGDGNLRKAAIREGVRILGTIGVLDRAIAEGLIDSSRYVELLKRLRDFPQSRLPKDEIDLRIRMFLD
jgi:predicted nucleic acid-binding protein